MFGNQISAKACLAFEVERKHIIQCLCGLQHFCKLAGHQGNRTTEVYGPEARDLFFERLKLADHLRDYQKRSLVENFGLQFKVSIPVVRKSSLNFRPTKPV